MSRRRLHMLVALLCTGLPQARAPHHQRPFAVSRPARVGIIRCANVGARRKGAAGRVTIVAIDDAIVNLGGGYPLPRAEIASRRGDRAAGAEGHRDRSSLVDKGPADGDAALAKALAARPTVLAARRYFPASFSLPRRTTGHWPLAEGRPFPAADPLCRPRGSRYRQCVDGQTGTPMSVPMLFRTSDKIELSFRFVSRPSRSARS